MRLDEALQIKDIDYSGSRPDYTIHDNNPNIIILDKKYPPTGKNKGDSILAFNLNYLEDLSTTEKKELIKDIQKTDDKIINLKGVKKFVSDIFKTKGFYDLDKDTKISRYRKLVRKFPSLMKIIRRYKKSAISK